MKKLKKDFIGKKRFCSTQCAHAFSGSRGSTGGKHETKVKKEKNMMKKSEPRSKVIRQQRNRGTVSDLQEESKQIETPVDQWVVYLSFIWNILS